MRRALLAGVALLALLFRVGSASAATERVVDMPARYFDPKYLVALVGDTVTWTNSDTRNHDVEALDGTFATGLFPHGGRYSFTFTRQGSYRYVCTIHRFMTGQIDVFGIALSGPPAAVPAGRRAVVHGLVPAGTPSVTLERREARGAFAPVATVPAAADGSFRIEFEPPRPAVYRAVSGELTSEPLAIPVTASLRLRTRATRTAALVRVHAAPAQPGAEVALERYVRERFTYVRVARKRLDPSSRATFRLRLRGAVHVRVVIVRGVRGYAGGASAAVRIDRPDG